MTGEIVKDFPELSLSDLENLESCTSLRVLSKTSHMGYAMLILVSGRLRGEIWNRLSFTHEQSGARARKHLNLEM